MTNELPRAQAKPKPLGSAAVSPTVGVTDRGIRSPSLSPIHKRQMKPLGLQIPGTEEGPSTSGLECRLPLSSSVTHPPASSTKPIHQVFMKGQDPHAVRILIVEDDRRLANMLRLGLEEEGFGVDLVDSGEEALAAATATPFDLVTVDVMLP